MFKKGLFSLAIIFGIGFSAQFIDSSFIDNFNKMNINIIEEESLTSNIKINSISNNEYISLNSSDINNFNLSIDDAQSMTFNLVENNLNSVALWTGVSIGTLVLLSGLTFGIYWIIKKRKNAYTKYGYYGDDGLFYYYDGYYGDDGMFYYYEGYYGDDGMFYYYDGYYGDDGLFYRYDGYYGDDGMFYYYDDVYGIEEYVNENDLSIYDQDSYYDDYQSTFETPISALVEKSIPESNSDDVYVPKRLSSTSNQSKRLSDLRKNNLRLYTNDKDEEISKSEPVESQVIVNDFKAENNNSNNEITISIKDDVKEFKTQSQKKNTSKQKDSKSDDILVKEKVIIEETKAKEEKQVKQIKTKIPSTSSNKNSKNKNTINDKDNSKLDSSKKTSPKSKNKTKVEKAEKNLPKSDELNLSDSNSQEDDYF